MIPKIHSREQISIKEAFNSMIKEEIFSLKKLKLIRQKLLDFIETNKTEFQSSKDIKMAKNIANFIINFDDDATVWNKISDFSNLLIDSAKYATELEEIIELLWLITLLKL